MKLLPTNHVEKLFDVEGGNLHLDSNSAPSVTFQHRARHFYLWNLTSGAQHHFFKCRTWLHAASGSPLRRTIVVSLSAMELSAP